MSRRTSHHMPNKATMRRYGTAIQNTWRKNEGACLYSLTLHTKKGPKNAVTLKKVS